MGARSSGRLRETETSTLGPRRPGSTQSGSDVSEAGPKGGQVTSAVNLESTDIFSLPVLLPATRWPPMDSSPL